MVANATLFPEAESAAATNSSLGPPVIEATPLEVKAGVLDYCSQVLLGTIPANLWVRLACKRFAADLDRSDVWMDWAAVAKFVTFCRGLKLTLSHAGKTFELLPWQLFFVANVYGWKFTEDGSQRFDFAVLQVARKAGKSTLAAAMCLYDFKQGTGKRVHVLSNTTEQSKLIVGASREMYRQTWPDQYDDHYRVFPRPRFFVEELDSEFTLVVAKDRTLDGLNPSLWVGDEASEWRGRFLTKLLTSQGARDSALGIIVTTPGENKDLIYTSEVLADAIEVLQGRLDLDSNFYLIYGIDEEDDPGDESVWEKANPGLRYDMPKPRYLRKQWKRMQLSPIRRAEFCRFHGARFAQTTKRWLDMNYWDEQANEGITLDTLRGRKAWIGIDLSAKHDLTTVVCWVPLDDGRGFMFGRYWWPEERHRDRELEYGVPLRRWVAEGRVVLCDGATVRYPFIREYVKLLAGFFELVGAAYDKWNAAELANELITIDRLPLVPYDMSNNTFVPGCAQFERLWLERKILHSIDPVLRRACADSGAKEVSTGQYRLIKAHRFSLIDPLVAGIYATHLHAATCNLKRSSYEGQTDIVI